MATTVGLGRSVAGGLPALARRPEGDGGIPADLAATEVDAGALDGWPTSPSPTPAGSTVRGPCTRRRLRRSSSRRRSPERPGDPVVADAPAAAHRRLVVLHAPRRTSGSCSRARRCSTSRSRWRSGCMRAARCRVPGADGRGRARRSSASTLRGRASTACCCRAAPTCCPRSYGEEPLQPEWEGDAVARRLRDGARPRLPRRRQAGARASAAATRSSTSPSAARSTRTSRRRARTERVHRDQELVRPQPPRGDDRAGHAARRPLSAARRPRSINTSTTRRSRSSGAAWWSRRARSPTAWSRRPADRRPGYAAACSGTRVHAHAARAPNVRDAATLARRPCASLDAVRSQRARRPR